MRFSNHSLCTLTQSAHFHDVFYVEQYELNMVQYCSSLCAGQLPRPGHVVLPAYYAAKGELPLLHGRVHRLFCVNLFNGKFPLNFR